MFLLKHRGECRSIADIGLTSPVAWVHLRRLDELLQEVVSWCHLRSVSKPIACLKLGGGKAPRLSEVHCDRDSVCVKTDTRDLGYRSQY